MKIAVLADIHANYQALQTVVEHIQSWKPDHVIVAGDIVNRGPRPLECLNYIREREHTNGWLLIRGNHEDYVISRSHPDAPLCGPAHEVHRASFWTYQRLENDVSALEIMPFHQSLIDPSDREVRVVHASMRGNRDGIYPETSDETLRHQIGSPPALFCVGHTHRPLIRMVDKTLVVNVGSAGLPFDGDNRPSYAQLLWQNGMWNANIVRVDYDIAAAKRDFFETGYIDGAGPITKLVLIELHQACSQLYNWARLYQDRAIRGEISMHRSVQEYMENQGLANYRFRN